MKKKVNVLQVGLGEKEYSGVSNWMFEHYKQLNHERVHFDFLFCRENTLALKQGSDVLKDSKIYAFNLSQIVKSKFLQYVLFYKRFNDFLKNHSYDVIHVNSGSYPLQTIVAIVSKKRKVKLHIAHSHSAHNNKSGKKQIILNFFAPIAKKLIVNKSDYLFACSDAAGEYLFGEKAEYRILPNGIEIAKYRYNQNVRNEIRLNEKISDENIIYCYVGRLAKSKNLMFMLDVFNQLHKINEKSSLWIIGEGEMRESLESQIRNYGLGDVVKMWGERNDVSVLLQGADAFLFTSFFEGLSLVVIEAQASGIPVFAADCISEEHKVTSLMHFCSLDKSEKEWADWITGLVDSNEDRRDTSEEITEAGYNIQKTAEWLENFYCEKVEN